MTNTREPLNSMSKVHDDWFRIWADLFRLEIQETEGDLVDYDDFYARQAHRSFQGAVAMDSIGRARPAA